MHAAAPDTVERTFGRARLAWQTPGVGLAALGLESEKLLFAPGPALSERYQVLEASAAATRARFPLPGTSDVRGNLTGRPGPLGTGWVWLTAYRGALQELLVARCTTPRSASLAEREWNLLCHLRAHGVGTPEPLLVGARGKGFVSRRSFVLVRAPEDALPLSRWLRTEGVGAERARGLEAVGRALALLVGARVGVPRLALDDLWLTPSGSGECETAHGGGLRKNKLPGVTLVRVRGARIHARPGPARAALRTFFRALSASCSADECAFVERSSRSERAD